MAKHPIQPIEVDDKGVERFKANAIVQHLLEIAPTDLNKVAMMDFTREDREQFIQLQGYSWSGAGDCSEMTDEVMNAAQRMYKDGETEDTARVRVLQDLLAEAKAYARIAADALAEILSDAQDE